MTTEQWIESFKKETTDIARMDSSTLTYEESAHRMRSLLKTGILRHDDITKRPERFFLEHRLLDFHSPQLDPGFWIRFTVHYNLCIGTINGLGSEEQIHEANQWQESGKLGCFGLTEKFAGVNSGLVVNTIAEYNEKTESFILNSPNEGAKKNWISQGLIADKTTVVADLRMGDKSMGPHAFIMSLRDDEGHLLPGITHGDMGRKTVGNDLDNAWIAFKNVKLSKLALLNRYADIIDNVYVQKVKGMPVFHMIGQRLFTGRIAVAQAAVEFRARIFEMTKEYTDKKKCWSPSAPTGENNYLSSLPQLAHIYNEENEKRIILNSFLDKCEFELCENLKNNTLPSLLLVEAIAAAKVKAVEESIDLVHRLKNEVGSYALMADSGFNQSDFLTCCKFAEGDSRVLMQKMSRDRYKLFLKSDVSKCTVVGADWDEEMVMCWMIREDMEATGKPAAWDDSWQEVYELANSIMDRKIRDFMEI
mmetsp:Transcript_3684/g.3834  ORF Transcript_3684/g.3834 Transcript_3684/m.3834 type:complete len:477 (-) Transcript_3684:40-1470(-)